MIRTIGIVCISLLFQMSLAQPEAMNSDWQYVTSVDDSKPIARHEAAFVAVGSKFYLLGGRGIKPVSIYDSKTGKWTQGSPSPIELHHFQPVVYRDNIYIIGAFTGPYPTETPVPNIYTYEPETNIWQKGTEIPHDRRRGGAGAVLVGSKIYVVCGITNGHQSGHKPWLDVYDPETQEWTKKEDAPRARDHFQAVATEGKIYAVAGRLSKAPEATFSETITEVDCYDLHTQRWTTLPNPLPTPRAGNAALFANGNVLVVGGESAAQTEAHHEVEALDVTTKKWETWPSMLRGRHGSSVLNYKGELYIASGCGNRGGNPELDSMEKLPLPSN